MENEMKITEIKTFVIDCFRTNWVFVKVYTDEGISGIGEGTLEYKENALVGAVKDLEHALIGKDPFNTEWIWHENYRDAYWRGGSVLMSALSAVDMALWDIKGKALSVPVWKLIGGKWREAVACYAKCWFAGAKEPSEFAEKAVAAVEKGFKGLKWDPFGKNYRQLPPEDFKKALKCVEKVKEATDGRAEILIECHGRFDMPTALRLCNALEEFDPYWVEEPLIPDTMRALADLRSRVRVPIAFGERLYTSQQIMEAVEGEVCDYLQPDSSHAGGITEMKKIAGICDARHIPFCAHNPSGPVANAVTLALGVSTPGYTIHETLFNDVP
jgi:galactonate dehydratase